MSELIQIFQLEISAHDKNYRKLRSVLAYIEEHFAKKIQISELSEIIHVCDDRLIRLFKEVTGVTPIEYIMNLRIEASIKLLSSTELSIADIAEQTGFGSATYMTRVFKQKFGRSPIEYVRARRIERAMELLRESDDPIEKIMAKIGFSDRSSFYHAFSAQNGMTPAEYRAMHEKK